MPNNDETNLKLRQMSALIKKNLELYFRKGPVIIFGLLFPFFMSLTWVLGSSIDPVQFFSGILGMSVFFISTAISPVVFPWETREKNLERILSAPITLLDIIISISLASTMFSLIISALVCIVLIIALNISIWVFFWFLFGSLLLSWIGSCLGVLFSAIPTDNPSNILTVSTLIRFPLIFISGIFIPLDNLSAPLFFLSLISPATYFVDLLKCVQGQGFLGIYYDLFALTIWILAISIITYFAHKKTIMKRFS
ncbi:MAG: ABC transporter permease [Candidatus Helarchaeota archaeon]